MTRLYLVDAYNLILQDRELNEILDYEGLAEARKALKRAVETFARRTGSRVRLIFDGAQDPHGHIEISANEWVEVSFTSTGEKADERLVAVALETRRKGGRPVVVSDDIEGVRRPLEEEGFALLATARFMALVHGNPERSGEKRGEALSRKARSDLEAEFLARDAEARRRAADEKSEAPPIPVKSGAIPPTRSAKAPPPPLSARPPSPLARTEPRVPSPDHVAKKEKGRKKQERRLAMLQSRRKRK